MSDEKTDEFKASNKKKIKVNGKEKWLLMDDEENTETVFSEADLLELVEILVNDSLQELFGKS